MMRQGHYSAASVPAVSFAWGLTIAHDRVPAVVPSPVPIFIALLCGVLIIWCSTWNDLDHPRFKGKMHPGAAAVRGTGRIFYMIRTDKDKHREDLHRGPSHCIEWCVLVGGLVVVLTSYLPPLAPWAWLWGVSVFLGTFSHVLADSMTPSGVPLSAIYNYLRYDEVWRRHTLNWFSTDSGAEHFGAVPLLYALTTLIVLAMFGALGPIFRWLVGLTA